MRTRTLAAILVLVVASIFAGADGSWAAFGEPGPGGGSGSGGGGGEEGSPDWGDMVVLYRDADGVPVISDPVSVTDPETGLPVDGGLCQQPLAAPGVTFANPDNTPCTPVGGSCLVPVDPLACAVVVGYETYLQPVDFARMNSARAPASTLDQQLADLLVNLSTAQCLSLDPAGRLVFTSPDTLDGDGDGDTTELVSAAVDSPLQNLAIYREMMARGVLGDPPIALPAPPFGAYGIIDTAAKGLGAASDKGGKIDVDVVVYLNQIQGLSDAATPTVLPKKCISYRDEVQGVVQLVEKCFLLYRPDGNPEGSPYGYRRSETYSNLPYPPYIPAQSPQAGIFEYLTLYTSPGIIPPLFWIVQNPILPAVFPDPVVPGGHLPGYEGGNIGGFAQASDDARAAIDFMHSHPVLVGFETPVSCGGTPPPPASSYDVAMSTLQMPKNAVGGTAREGTLTVTNAKGPDAASGTVDLIGTDTTGAVLSFSFSFTYLTPGASQSWTVAFTSPTYATTIAWTATVNAQYDVLGSNNTLTATTKVSKPRGKGTGEGE